MTKEYIGDSVYVELDGEPGKGHYRVTLTTENGATVSNVIMLEPQVISNLLNFLRINKVMILD